MILYEDENWTLGLLLGQDYSHLKGQSRVKIELDLWPSPLISIPEQVHGCKIRDASDTKGCDGLIIKMPSSAVGVLSADCYSLALFGKSKGVLMHAGRQGVLNGILAQARAALASEEELVLFIGPGIANYEIKGLVEQIRALGYGAFLQGDCLDLRGIIRAQAEVLGITNIKDCDIDSASKAGFFSHRRGEAGRHLTYLYKKPDASMLARLLEAKAASFADDLNYELALLLCQKKEEGFGFNEGLSGGLDLKELLQKLQDLEDL